MTKKEAIRQYHGRRFEFVWKSVEKGYCTEDDLWFLIPNGWKRMHGFLVTRTFEKRKSAAKRNRKRRIMFSGVFGVMIETIDKILPKAVETTFSAFVNFKSVPFGDVSTS